MITIQEMNGYARKIGLAYEKALLPLSKEIDMPHTAISILLFIANNPDFATASYICDMRGLKRPIVSAHVENLVQRGYIERRAFPGDRRKDALVCTEKAQKIVEAGRERQIQFAKTILAGISEEDRAVMERCFKLMDENIDTIIKEK
ncbi:MAG: MarR family transcriptional regulator [Clostridia bacterium]|nr:MarR family transcriptional regulator [Clostridia bacterium]MBQ7315890.1 MarR family transcriptional regulator [Clostridia bacterium]